MCVQGVDVQCVLQFTLIHAAGCALHRRASRVIHCPKLYGSNRIGSSKKEKPRKKSNRRGPPLTRRRLERGRSSSRYRGALPQSHRLRRNGGTAARRAQTAPMSVWDAPAGRHPVAECASAVDALDAGHALSPGSCRDTPKQGSGREAGAGNEPSAVTLPARYHRVTTGAPEPPRLIFLFISFLRAVVTSLRFGGLPGMGGLEGQR